MQHQNGDLEVTSIGPQAATKLNANRSQVQRNTVRCATKNAQFHQRFNTVRLEAARLEGET